MANRSEKIKIFIVYAHEDEELCEKLKKHLTGLERNGEIELWYDRKIIPGEIWDYNIKEQLEESEIFLFLISSDFMYSNYIDKVEVKKALERKKNGEADIIPIMLKHYHLDGTPLSQLQGLPTDMKPVISKYWDSEDEAFFDIVKGLKKRIDERIEKKEKKLIEKRSTNKKVISDCIKNFLDREIQVTEFGKQIIVNNSKVQFYLIHGDKNQSPDSLYRRLYQEEDQICNSIHYIEPIILNSANDIEAAQISFLRKLFGKFGLYLKDFQKEKWDITGLLDSIQVKDQHYRYIFIGITIDSDDWKDYMPYLLEDWFINGFCKKELKQNDPNFIFVFQINYSLENETKDINRIEYSLKKIQNIFWLPRLEMVKKSHIEKWFDTYLSECEEKDEYFEKYFGQGTNFPMKEVLKKLTRIIKENNEKII